MGRARKRRPRARAPRTEGGEIAHEVNNLLMGLVGCAEVAVTRLDEGAIEAAREAIVDLREAAKRGATLTERPPAPEDEPLVDPRALSLGIVLVVDDEPLVRRALRHMLDGRCADVVEVADGDEALALLRREPVDLLVCDISLPGAPGREVVRRALEAQPLLRAVCMSSKPRALLLAEGLLDPAVPFVQKPFAFGDLQLALSPRAPPREGAKRGGGVLVVEDDELMRNALRALIESWRLPVLEAASVDAALALLADGSPGVGVVLSDLLLDGASGDVLARALRRRGDGVPIVFMTGLRREDPLVLRALAAQGTSLLRKPFDPDALRDAILTHLGEVPAPRHAAS